MVRSLGYALACCGLLAVGSGLARADQGAEESAEIEAHVKVQLNGVRDRVGLGKGEDGSLYFYLRSDQGGIERLTPEAFANRVYGEQSRQSWWNRVLNVTSPIGIAWVGLGFLGQLMFTGRMLVQWLVSEKEHRSVVPPAFWWMSLAGASMLLVYFIWRRDIVGVLGQTTGWIIYVRNLWLIYRAGGGSPDLSGDPGPEPELIQS